MSRDPNSCPTHPGALLREDLIPATGKSKTELSRTLGISLRHLHDFLSEREDVSLAVAERLAMLFGNSPLFWIGMQANYDAWHVPAGEDVPPTSGLIYAKQTDGR